MRCKTTLVVEGFREGKGVDFGEIFSLIGKIPSSRVVQGLDPGLGLVVEQTNV